MPGAESVIYRLESAFSRIQRERMMDVPILNPVLEVRAIDFQLWNDCWTGVLITPWFMNLMQLPSLLEDWSWQWPGQSIGRELPAGFFEFTSGMEAETGPFLSCSLFSPMHEFTDQRTAEATARAIMTHVMQPIAAVQSPSLYSRRNFLRGGQE